MREAKVIISVYKYDELNNAAKGVVKDKYLENNHTAMEFDIKITRRLDEIGFHDIDIEFSLTYCQGDGVSFTGKINCEDLFNINYIKDRIDLSDEVIANLKDTLNSVEIIRIDKNYTNYNTCKVVLNGDLTWMNDKEYCNLYDVVTQYYQYLCKRFETKGYRFFYEVEEEEIIKYCNDNDLEFTSDGRIFHRTLETI